MRPFSYLILCIGLLNGCQRADRLGAVPSTKQPKPPKGEALIQDDSKDGLWELNLTPIVSASAAGWNIKPGPPEKRKRSHPTTIVVNPQGKAVNIGTTQYPDWVPATLWIVEVEELEARFLLIQVSPVASAAVGMWVLYLDNNDDPSVAGVIVQSFEWADCAREHRGREARIQTEGKFHRLRDVLFEDSDGDGVLELVEDDTWKEGGTVTFHRFTDKKTFEPLWRERWERREDESWERVSRTRVVSDRED